MERLETESSSDCMQDLLLCGMHGMATPLCMWVLDIRMPYQDVQARPLTLYFSPPTVLVSGCISFCPRLSPRRALTPRYSPLFLDRRAEILLPGPPQSPRYDASSPLCAWGSSKALRPWKRGDGREEFLQKRAAARRGSED